MTTTPNLSLIKPTVGADSDTWGDSWNDNADVLDTLFQTGTFTPIDASGAGMTFSFAVGIYRKSKGSVLISMKVIFPTTADGSNVRVGGLPFTAANVPMTGFPITAFPTGGGSPAAIGFVSVNTTTMSLNMTSGVAVSNSVMSGNTLYVNGEYPI